MLMSKLDALLDGLGKMGENLCSKKAQRKTESEALKQALWEQELQMESMIAQSKSQVSETQYPTTPHQSSHDTSNLLEHKTPEYAWKMQAIASQDRTW
eukprot:860051-Ditylum_brightwellii.AAC.1